MLGRGGVGSGGEADVNRAALALLLTGCHGERGYVYDERFTPAEVQAIEDCLGEWARAADLPELDRPVHGPVSLPHEGDFDYVRDFTKAPRLGEDFEVHAWVSTGPEYAAASAAHGNYPGSGFNARGNLAVVTDLVTALDGVDGGPSFRAILLHEMGHTLWLPHLEGGVMAPEWPIPACIGRDELAVLCALRTCGPAAAPTCGASRCEGTAP